MTSSSRVTAPRTRIKMRTGTKPRRRPFIGQQQPSSLVAFIGKTNLILINYAETPAATKHTKKQKAPFISGASPELGPQLEMRSRVSSGLTVSGSDLCPVLLSHLLDGPPLEKTQVPSKELEGTLMLNLQTKTSGLGWFPGEDVDVGVVVEEPSGVSTASCTSPGLLLHPSRSSEALTLNDLHVVPTLRPIQTFPSSCLEEQ